MTKVHWIGTEERYSARNNVWFSCQRKALDDMDGQHQVVDKSLKWEN